MRRQTCLKLAMETATAALVADPEKYQSALDGTTVNLGLTSISLLTRDELGQWDDQYRAFAELERSSPIRLSVQTPEGSLHPVNASVRVRQFVVSAEDEPFSGGRQNERHRRSFSDAFERLLGSADSPELGGDAAIRIVEMNDRIAQSRLELDELKRQNSLVQAEGRVVSIDAFLQDFNLSARNVELVLEERSVRTLEAAGKQLKSILVSAGDRPAGKEERGNAMARVALVTHLMGETPLLSCMSGRHFTQRLDSEIKLLATVAEMLDGGLPSLELDVDRAALQAARDAFLRP